jgi:hypothetical protein
VGKSTLKLTGVYEAWGRNVRSGRLTRATGVEAPVLVRVDESAVATPELLLRLREDARLLGRLQHESVLRIEHITAVSGSVGVVYEGFECASAARILRVLRMRNQVLPARAAVEAAAAVGLALDEALRIVDGDRAVFHPAPSPEDVLVDTAGRVKLAGFRVSRAEDAPSVPPKGYAAPEGGAAPPAATYLVGALLVELLSGESPPEAAADPERHEAAVRRALIRVLARPGDTPGEPVVAAIRSALAHDPTVRGGPGALGKKLRELAVALQSPGLRAWAPGSIPSVQRFAAPASDGRAAPGPLPLLAEETNQRPPLGAGQTIAPMDGPALAEALRGGPGAPLPDGRASSLQGASTIVPPPELADELLAAAPPRGAAGPSPAGPGRSVAGPGRSVAGRSAGPAVGPFAGAPAAPERSAARAPLPATSTGIHPLPPRSPGLGGLSDPTAPAPHAHTGAPPLDIGPSARRGPSAAGLSAAGPSAARGPAVAPPARGPSGPAVAPPRAPTGLARGPYLEPVSEADESEATIVAGHRPPPPRAPIDPLGVEPAPVMRSLSPAASAPPPPSLLDGEQTESHRRPAWLLPVVLGLGVFALVAALVVGAGAWVLNSGLDEVDATPAPVVTEPLAEPAVPAPSAVAPLEAAPPPLEAAPPPREAAPSPPVPTPTPAPAAPSAPPKATATPPKATATPPKAPAATATPASTATRPAPPVEPEPDDDAPVRISSHPATSTAPATPTAPAAPAPAAPATGSAAPAFFRVEFFSGDPSVETLEIKCSQGAGSGPSVALEQVPKGNCRVTGRGGDAPLIAMVTVVADRSYTCFAGRVPSCK